MQEKRILIVFILIIILSTVCSLAIHKHHQETLYAEIKQEVNAENWKTAKRKLDELGIYRDSEKILYTVNYHYYLDLGDDRYNEEIYDIALEFYNKAKQYSNNEMISQKISKVEKIISKQQAEEQKKKLESERKQKLEQERIQQIKIREKKKQLAEIEPVIKRTFYKIDFLEDKSLNARMYDFYIDPNIWLELPYDSKENAFKLAVLYVKLKTNAQYSNSDYQFSTKIRNASTKSVLAEYTAFNGIKLK